MSRDDQFDIFLAAVPGIEPALQAEARAKRFKGVQPAKGGVTIRGDWPDVWRANLALRMASRVMARTASFRVFHLAQLDKRARRVPWQDILRPDVPFRVEATCSASRIYHSGAAAQRIERAISEELGARSDRNAVVCVKARIENDLCTISIDTSGEPLHRRGHKEAVAKAPMRETLAAAFLFQCGFTGSEPLLDPMCGSGTFVIEAAEIAAGLEPGRSRSFAFEQLAGFDDEAWQRMRNAIPEVPRPAAMFYGRERDPGAIRMSRANAARAGVGDLTTFAEDDVSTLAAPEGPPGLVIVNPPYGARIGERQQLTMLHRSLGQNLKQRFSGWRVGLITSERQLAEATGLPFADPCPPVLHGGLRVTLYRTDALP